MKIKVVLEISNGSQVVYPGDDTKWFNTYIETDVNGNVWLVGDYTGEITFNYVPWVEIIDYGRKITKLAFRNRWLPEERVAFDLASIHNPNATIEQQQAAAVLRDIQQNLSDALYIDLDRPDTVAAVTYVLTLFRTILGYNQAKYAERFNAILNTPVVKEEVPVFP